MGVCNRKALYIEVSAKTLGHPAWAANIEGCAFPQMAEKLV